MFLIFVDKFINFANIFKRKAMKKKNCKCEYIDSRNARLRAEYLSRLGTEVTNTTELFKILAKLPAPRFYINEDRAYVIIKKRMRTGSWGNDMLPTRLKMIKEIARRVVVEMESNYALSLKHAVCKVVNSPAPLFYLSARSIRTIVYKALRPHTIKNYE